MEDIKIEDKKLGFWYSEWGFIVFVMALASGIFGGTHLYYTYHVGAFNDLAVVALLEAGLKGGGFGAAAAFGGAFLFARVIEGPLVGILDIGGALQTGVGIAVENAIPLLKEKADFITSSNDKLGVARMLEKIFLDDS